jgi:hypothetical protein
MPTAATSRRRHPFWAGFIAALSACVVGFLVIGLWQSATTATFLAWTGLMFLIGVLLLLPERTWLAGVGFLVGAAISVAGAVAIAVLWAVQHTV